MPDETLDIRTTRIKDTLYIALSGELDMDNAEDVVCLRKVIKDPTLTSVELDLTGLTYLDSVGLMQVARFYRSARSHLAPLTVHVCDGSQVQRVLRLIGAGDLFAVVPEARSPGRS